MLDHLKDKLVCELKDVSKDGVKTGNIEYIAKLAETYKNLNKAEKEELESMMYDERMDRRYSRDEYDTYGRGGRGGSYMTRDGRGRYSNDIRPIERGYDDYIGAKRRYRNSDAPKDEMFDGLEMLMKHVTLLIEDLYKDCDSEDERRIMDKYIRRLQEMH